MTTPDYILKLRSDFPILSEKVNGKPLVYLDNGATAQKPNLVIDTIADYYKKENANIHRGVHHLSQVATLAYENSRKTIQNFINAAHEHEIIFTKGTTDGINLVANCLPEILEENDEILISQLEHHSNIVPWQMACEKHNLKLRYIPMLKDGSLDLSDIDTLINSKTKLVAVTHVSNALGTINPIAQLIEKSHKVGAKILIDGAQSLQHMEVDVQKLDCDFYIFSGHKLFGPTGVGILYGKEDVLNAMPPYQGGGDMIKTVTLEKTVYNDLPHKFEAGTPNIVGGIGLGKAIEYMQSLDSSVFEHEHQLLEYAKEQLSTVDGIQFYGTAKEKCSVISFLIEGTHPYDLGTIIDKLGIAVRTGHHCAQPIMDFYEIPGTIRASFAFYNTFEEVDLLVSALKRAIKMLK